MPDTKGEKDSLNFLLNYTKLVHCLFQLTKEKRNKLYMIEASSINDYDNEIYNLISALNKLISKKANETTNSQQKFVSDKMKLIYSPAVSDVSHLVIGRFAQYHFSISLFIPSINYNNYILYNRN